MKVGDLVKCVSGRGSGLLGVITVVDDPCGSGNRWAYVQWIDGKRTWEEWEPSMEAGCFEVIA